VGSPGHARRRRGRGWFSKRWIYWKRRYSNPTLRDWVLLAVLTVLVLAAVAAPVSFRLSGWLLAAVCGAAGVLRLLPDPWWATVRNRGRGFDAALFFGTSAALALLTASVPG
ncbi:MAG TPA: hypothetical protein VK039_12310, partial [Brevibacterium sp.]|nr:hypothetical protein [Brevibacterium sp.]